VTPLPYGAVVASLDEECGRAEEALRSLDDDDLGRPTRCPAWDVRGLTGHLIRDVDRIVAYLEAPAPDPPADTDAIAYFRGFDPVAAAPGVARRSMETAAAFATLDDLADGFARIRRDAVRAATVAGPDRLIAVSWGQRLAMADYVPTRVVEMTVHGLDLQRRAGRQAELVTQWLGDDDSSRAVD